MDNCLETVLDTVHSSVQRIYSYQVCFKQCSMNISKLNQVIENLTVLTGIQI